MAGGDELLGPAVLGLERETWPIISSPAAAAAASMIASASSSVRAIGFSHSTWAPEANASVARARCVGVGVQTLIASTPSSSTSPSDATPRRRAARRAARLGGDRIGDGDHPDPRRGGVRRAVSPGDVPGTDDADPQLAHHECDVPPLCTRRDQWAAPITPESAPIAAGSTVTDSTTSSR